MIDGDDHAAGRCGYASPWSKTSWAPVELRGQVSPLGQSVGAPNTLEASAPPLGEYVPIAILECGKVRSVAAPCERGNWQNASAEITRPMGRGVVKMLSRSHWPRFQDFADASSTHVVVAVVNTFDEGVERFRLATSIALLKSARCHIAAV